MKYCECMPTKDHPSSSQNRLRGMLRQEAESALPVEFEKRIASCRGTLRSNCRGTALFITGEIKSDRAVDALFAYGRIVRGTPKHPKLRRLDTPVPGCIIVWNEREGNFDHMGVVISVNPHPRITHRKELNDAFLEGQSLDEATKATEPWSDHCTIAYYLPRALGPK